jgi:hypothetical protein
MTDRSRTTDEFPMLTELLNEPSPFQPSTRIIHRILTPEEDALVGHVRGYCHNSKACRLCDAEAALNDTFHKAADYKARLDSIIGG